MNLIKNKIRKLDNLSDLNELSAFINDCKVMLGKSSINVGDKVWVVQKTKKTAGKVIKMNMNICIQCTYIIRIFFLKISCNVNDNCFFERLIHI